MKIRTGFVSNSSSSSFIIGVGVVKDEEKLKKFIEDNKFSKWQVSILIKEQIKNDRWQKSRGENKVSSCDFNDYIEVSMPLQENEDKYVVVRYFGNENDCYFYDDNDDIDYDIDESFFSNSIQEPLLSLGEKEGVINYECKFGAGRNG